MCKRRFKTRRVGGEVLTNGITLRLLVIRPPGVERVLLAGPVCVSPSRFHPGVRTEEGGERGDKSPLATISSSEEKGPFVEVELYVIYARETRGSERARGDGAESITFISSASAKSRIIYRARDREHIHAHI